MADNQENSALFPIFILSVIGLPLVPYTVLKIFRAATRSTRNIHCECSVCTRSGKYRKSNSQRISSFLSCSNVTLILLWLIVGLVAYSVKQSRSEIQVFEPFSILGLEPGASDSAIKKAYRRLSIQYHPDKNPDPDANKYFVEYISKAYQALTDPISRENFEKYGHPDGRQGFQVGIALPEFLLAGASGGVLLIWILGGMILLPLIIGVIYLSRSSQYSGNVRRETLSTYFNSVKPSLAPSKIMEVFIKAAEYMEIPVRRSDDEPLQKLFSVVKGELNLDGKNAKQEQAKYWKQHPSLIKTELLIQAHLTRKAETLSPDLQRDYKHVLQLAPRLLEELFLMANLPRTSKGHGWLRPAIGVVELSQCIVQAIPLSARKATRGSSEGVAPFLQLPHFSDTVIEKIAQKARTFQDFRDMTSQERAELLAEVAGLSAAEAQDIEKVLELMPRVTVDVSCETEGEEGIQEGDIVTVQAWVMLKRANGLIGALPHNPYYPFPKEENFWFLLADANSNNVWLSQKVSFTDEAGAITAASKIVEDKMEALGADAKEISPAVKEATERVKSGSRLVMGKIQAPAEGTYNLTSYLLCDSWLGCDNTVSVKVKVLRRNRTGTRVGRVAEGEQNIPDDIEDEDATDEDEYDEEEEVESEYSEEEEEEEEDDTQVTDKKRKEFDRQVTDKKGKKEVERQVTGKKGKEEVERQITGKKGKANGTTRRKNR
nr:DnaJ protein ERDJ2A-like [Ipomoea batatas]